MTNLTRSGSAKLSRFTLIALILGSLFSMFVVLRTVQCLLASRSEAQGYLVLGGNAVREAFSAELAKAHPDRVVLISGGSDDPCLWLMFEKHGVSMENIWAEHCSQNTFENFVYSLPILERLNVRKVLLVTEHPQVERALPIAWILFASHGMVVEFQDTPGAQSTDVKSDFEIVGLAGMALCWAVVSQVYQPTCQKIMHLPDVDMEDWYRKGFRCQPQTGVRNHLPRVDE